MTDSSHADDDGQAYPPRRPARARGLRLLGEFCVHQPVSATGGRA